MTSKIPYDEALAAGKTELAAAIARVNQDPDYAVVPQGDQSLAQAAAQLRAAGWAPVKLDLLARYERITTAALQFASEILAAEAWTRM